MSEASSSASFSHSDIGSQLALATRKKAEIDRVTSAKVITEAKDKPTLAQQMVVAAAASPSAFLGVYLLSGLAAAATSIYVPVDGSMVGTSDKGGQLMIFCTSFFSFVATAILLTNFLFARIISEKQEEASMFLLAMNNIVDGVRSSTLIRASEEAAKDTQKGLKGAIGDLKKELESAEKDTKRLKELRGTMYKDGKPIASMEELSKYLRASGQPLLDVSTLSIIARDSMFKRNNVSYDDVLIALKKAFESNANGMTTARLVSQLSGKTIPDLAEHRAKDSKELSDSIERLSMAVTSFQKVHKDECQKISRKYEELNADQKKAEKKAKKDVEKLDAEIKMAVIQKSSMKSFSASCQIRTTRLPRRS